MTPALEAACAAVAVAIRTGNKVLAFGNGGSATQAQHFAAELVVRCKEDRPGLPSIALTCDGAILTACANDYAYDYVFARQVEALGRPGDVALGLSTSGTSPNVVKALGGRPRARPGHDPRHRFPVAPPRPQSGSRPRRSLRRDRPRPGSHPPPPRRRTGVLFLSGLPARAAEDGVRS
ncbi:MAG: SIS domain-containing protein [Holophagales bacterium]|nr:SIS domain-containing protein [Holophagales bacterium]